MKLITIENTWARGSVAERTVHIRKVIGSIPIEPTILFTKHFRYDIINKDEKKGFFRSRIIFQSLY